jgi:TolA protein
LNEDVFVKAGQLFVIVLLAALAANALTLLTLVGARSLLPSGTLGPLTTAIGLGRGESTVSAPSKEVAEKWVPMIQERIRQFWIQPPGSLEGKSALVNVKLEPDGQVISNQVAILQSSGDPSFDQSVVAAIYDASPLPVPSGRDFEPFRDFDLRLRP